MKKATNNKLNNFIENKKKGLLLTHLTMQGTNIQLSGMLYLILADIGYALALNMFYAGNNIAAGGLAGIGTILNFYFGIPIGLSVLILTLPIALFGIKVKGVWYVISALVTTAVYAIIVDALSFLPCISNDKMVAAVFGGILYGTSASLAIKAHLSTGGTDLLAKILITKFKRLSIGTLLLFIDGTIVLFSMIAYKNFESGIYAILAISISSIVTDKINSGFNRAQVFLIFSNENTDLIIESILYKMNRGVTKLTGIGQYSCTNKDILFVVVKPSEVPDLKRIIHTNDPSAFTILISANEIIGNGFEDTNLTESIND